MKKCALHQSVRAAMLFLICKFKWKKDILLFVNNGFDKVNFEQSKVNVFTNMRFIAIYQASTVIGFYFFSALACSWNTESQLDPEKEQPFKNPPLHNGDLANTRF